MRLWRNDDLVLAIRRLSRYGGFAIISAMQKIGSEKQWLYEEFCGTNPVSAVRWHQRGFANATPDMLCAQSQRTICTKLPWVALKTAAKTRIEMEWRSRYGSANDMRSFLRSVSGASLIRIGVSTKNFEDPKQWEREWRLP